MRYGRLCVAGVTASPVQPLHDSVLARVGTLQECGAGLLKARAACDGSKCRSCLAELDALGSRCVDARCTLGGTPRGATFLQQFHQFRHGTVGGQCAASQLEPPAEFSAMEDVLCSSEVRVRPRPRCSRGARAPL